MIKSLPRHAGLLAGIALLGITTAGSAEAAGLLTPKGSASPLMIVDHVVDVVVEDGFAVTTVEQTFANPGASDLEAIYAFPVPIEAAVAEFTYWIDGQPVTAEVLPRAAARQAYEEEKAAGRETALAEQNGHMTFNMSVWPVRANADVRVRMAYIQPARLDSGVGRYLYPLEDGGVDQVAQAFWSADPVVHGRFRFDLRLHVDYPVDAVRVPDHANATVAQTADGWHVTIDNGAPAPTTTVAAEGAEQTTATAQPAAALDTDVLVYWRQVPGLPGQADLLLHKPDAAGPGTFMLTLTPGDDLPLITGGRDWTFIVDKSGSMEAKMATLLNGLSDALGKLGPQDRFRIVLFDDTAAELTPGFQPVSPETIAMTRTTLSGIDAGNSTNLFAGLKRGLRGHSADRPSGVILITDGVANVGPTGNRDFLDLVSQTDVRLFTVIMGNSANEPLLAHLADISNGATAQISNGDDVVGVIQSAMSKLNHQAMNQIEVDVTGVKVADVTPVEFGALYRGQQLVVFGHYFGAGEATVTVRGNVAGSVRDYSGTFSFPDTIATHPELERLWAFSAIEDGMRRAALLGDTPDSRQNMTDIALQYGLLTPFTSMVVLREEQFAARGIERRNERRVATEVATREARHQNAPLVHGTAVVSGTPRAHVGTGAGPVGPLFVALLAWLGLTNTRARRRRQVAVTAATADRCG